MEQQTNQLSRLTKLGGNMPRSLLIAAVLVVIAGVGTGYFASQKGSVGGLGGKVEVAPGAVIKDKEVGLEDEKTFRDQATGILRDGGLEGEGTHHLEREGGSSQNAYLTSSVIDLDGFVGHKVTVWGETNKGQKAGWLMDVGKIKIVD